MAETACEDHPQNEVEEAVGKPRCNFHAGRMLEFFFLTLLGGRGGSRPLHRCEQFRPGSMVVRYTAPLPQVCNP